MCTHASCLRYICTHVSCLRYICTHVSCPYHFLWSRVRACIQKVHRIHGSLYTHLLLYVRVYINPGWGAVIGSLISLVIFRKQIHWSWAHCRKMTRKISELVIARHSVAVRIYWYMCVYIDRCMICAHTHFAISTSILICAHVVVHDMLLIGRRWFASMLYLRLIVCACISCNALCLSLCTACAICAHTCLHRFTVYCMCHMCTYMFTHDSMH